MVSGADHVQPSPPNAYEVCIRGELSDTLVRELGAIRRQPSTTLVVPTIDQAALVFVALFNGVPFAEGAVFHGDAVLGEFAIRRCDLAFGADATPTANRVEIDTKLARGCQNGGACREMAAFARRGEDDVDLIRHGGGALPCVGR